MQIYKGPQVVRRIKNELYSLLNAKGEAPLLPRSCLLASPCDYGASCVAVYIHTRCLGCGKWEGDTHKHCVHVSLSKMYIYICIHWLICIGMFEGSRQVNRSVGRHRWCRADRHEDPLRIRSVPSSDFHRRSAAQPLHSYIYAHVANYSTSSQCTYVYAEGAFPDWISLRDRGRMRPK